MKVWHNLYEKLIIIENVVAGYEEFRVGKKKKKDVLEFERHREDNLFSLHESLKTRTYRPGSYSMFYITDPKLRLIHKATVQDRVVHHIVSNVLEEIFEPTFYAHSYSCRKGRGTHKAVLAFQKIAYQVSKNNTQVCWTVKCDIKKFFASVNHKVLLNILQKKIKDEDFMDLLSKIINSFYSDRTIDLSNKKGIPIGNLTSQFFANIYLNEMDQYVKHTLKVPFYLRYADDFIVLSPDREHLEKTVAQIQSFLKKELDLELHPNKVIYRKFSNGVDFLGYIVFPHFILPRTKTKRRLLRKIHWKIQEFKAGKITYETVNQTIQSYLGYISHANTHELREKLQNLIWFWLTE